MTNTTTIKTIAETLGISISTVSRALQNNPRIGIKTRELVQKTAVQLNYLPNQASHLLRKKSTRIIGIMVPTLNEEFFCQIIDAVEEVVREKGYYLQIFQSKDIETRQLEGLNHFKYLRVEGVLVSLAAETSKIEAVSDLEKFGIPVVYFDRVPRNKMVHKIKSNVDLGTKEAIEFLRGKGVEKLAFINGPSLLDTSDDRLNGYLRGVMTYNLKTSPNMIKSTDLSEKSVADALPTILNEKPDAIFTFNDYIALYAMEACKKKGIKPNKDVLFVSYGNLPFTKYMDNPPMASVEQYPEKIGKEAANIMLERLGEKDTEPVQILVDTKLIIH
ncbi:MAG: LacI family transcriptional regulator [Bacteroidetes bacterium]|nr:LacI family transcriptional regulator [Bacteroidota bacterium]